MMKLTSTVINVTVQEVVGTTAVSGLSSRGIIQLLFFERSITDTFTDNAAVENYAMHR
jgi:GrpB-like predicted nucleotidyltransferase (UPF0157 family)